MVVRVVDVALNHLIKLMGIIVTNTIQTSYQNKNSLDQEVALTTLTNQASIHQQKRAVEVQLFLKQRISIFLGR